MHVFLWLYTPVCCVFGCTSQSGLMYLEAKAKGQVLGIFVNHSLPYSFFFFCMCMWYVCIGTCKFMCVVYRPEVDVQSLPWSLSTLFIAAGFLPGPGACSFCLVAPQLVSESLSISLPSLGITGHLSACLAFVWVPEIWTLVLTFNVESPLCTELSRQPSTLIFETNSST